MITRDDVKRRQARRRVEAVKFPDDGDATGLHARSLTCGELNRYAERSDKLAADIDRLMLLASFTLSDENGSLIFDEGDVESIGGFSLNEVVAICEAADNVNGFSKQAEEAIEGN